MRIPGVLCVMLLIIGCTGIPEGIEPVRNFELDRYLGIWYEIARLDHSFERGLEQVTAEYSIREKGGINVINRGFSRAENKWKRAEGKAFFVKDMNTGFLKVSFFGPFYGSYIIFELDKDNYRYAFVTSSSRSYLWFLSRTPVVSDETRELFLKRAAELGFDTSGLIFVKHN